MTVEIFLRKKEEVVPVEEPETLPDSLMELEMALKELERTTEKLKESTDLLIEEFHKSDKANQPEAREYYEYIEDNRAILSEKAKLMDRITRKMNQIRGVFDRSSLSESVSSGAGGMVEGHFL